MYQNQGFTLIELLVVVLIIGILAAVALPQYQKTVDKSRYLQLVLAGRAIYRAEELYYLANGTYADQLTDLDAAIPNGKMEDGLWVAEGRKFICNFYPSRQEIYCGKTGLPHFYSKLTEKRDRCRCFDTRTCAVCKTLGTLSGGSLSGGSSYEEYNFN